MEKLVKTFKMFKEIVPICAAMFISGAVWRLQDIADELVGYESKEDLLGTLRTMEYVENLANVLYRYVGEIASCSTPEEVEQMLSRVDGVFERTFIKGTEVVVSMARLRCIRKINSPKKGVINTRPVDIQAYRRHHMEQDALNGRR